MDQTVISDIRPNQGLDGKFLPGNNANAAGSEGGWQKPATRIAYLAERYSPDEISAFAESRYLRSKLPYWDSVYVMWMARAQDPELTRTKAGTDDLRGERKELLDRVHGQTKATTELTGAGGSALIPQIKIVFETDASSPAELQSANVPETIDQIPVDCNQEQAQNDLSQTIKIGFE